MTELPFDIDNRRVLLVGFSERYKYFGQMFYATFQMMRNGFIRAGTGAYLFSDRDTADFAAPLAIRQLGKIAANKKLLTLVDELEPVAIGLMHCDLITDQTIEQIRRVHPKVSIFSYFIDPIHIELQHDRFARFVSLSDVSFATTAGPALAKFRKYGNVGFMPNPIDPTVFFARSFERDHHQHDFFFAGKPKGRDSLLTELEGLLPSRNCGFYMRVARGSKFAIGGATYHTVLGRSKIAINAAVDDSPYFYSSDRVAQYFSAGCLVAQPNGAKLDELYGPGTMLSFSDAQELADKAEDLLQSGRWKEIARHGQERAVAVSNSELIARYMIDRCAGQQSFDWPAWSNEFYTKE